VIIVELPEVIYMVVKPPVLEIREVLGLDAGGEVLGDSEPELGVNVRPVPTDELPKLIELELELYV
jgi:hypothetical protein